MLSECSNVCHYIEAGPVQTSLAAVYTGEGHEDDVGLDMEGAGEDNGEEEGVSGGGLASWLSWSR